MPGSPQVILIGGGFAGLNAAQGLKRAPVKLLLLDRSNYHLFQPLLYQVASCALSPVNIATPLRDVLRHQNSATVLMADVVAIDKEKRQVISGNGEVFPYNYLILAPGARHAYFGRPEWENFAPGLKTLQDALRIRERLLLSFERAERSKNPSEIARFMRFAIVGAGPTGVEMAGAIAEMAHRTLVKNFRLIKTENSEVFLIEGGNRILPSYSPDLSERAASDLKRLGVNILLNSLVTKVSQDGVWIGEKFIETPNMIWAAGNSASPLLQSLNLPLDRFGRPLVTEDLSLPGFPEIFVIGDAACTLDSKGNALPGIAPVAIQQGKYVATTIKNRLDKRPNPPFRYRDKGMMATIGKAKAVGQIGKIKIRGYLAWLAWGFVHIFYLISFSNRFLVMFDWFYLYLFNRRRVRLITRTVTDSDDPMKF